MNLLACCVAGSSGFKIRPVSCRPFDEAKVNFRDTVPVVVVIALPSLAKHRMVIEVGECEERLAHGDSKTVTPAGVWENAEKFRQLSANCRKFDILGRTGGTKVNAFSNQNWP